ncbi:MAG: hypothetical protein ACRBFS_25235 [Aureispira sp.]
MKNQKNNNSFDELSKFIQKNRSSLSVEQLNELEELEILAKNTQKSTDVRTKNTIGTKLLSYILRQEAYEKIKEFIEMVFEEIE